MHEKHRCRLRNDDGQLIEERGSAQARKARVECVGFGASLIALAV